MYLFLRDAKLILRDSIYLQVTGFVQVMKNLESHKKKKILFSRPGKSKNLTAPAQLQKSSLAFDKVIELNSI